MENKYKICVYTICKNEEKFVDRWFHSMKEADAIYVLDTGSTDKTVKKLKKLGVHVKKKKIKPWRFDMARNESLKLVPDDFDICVCTDLDEVLEKGWHQKLETIWDSNINRLYYQYNWSLDEQNQPIISFYSDKIHSRKNYQWTHPVHEVLTYLGPTKEELKVTDKIVLNHYPDRSKSRSSYLPLLELSVKEDPEDDRNMHYLGREYMYYGRWNDCIDTLIKHLQLNSATWKDERCASMRFIARSYKNLKRYEEAKMWLDKAIIEAPYLREPYAERVLLEYQLKNYQKVIEYGSEALEIKEHPKSYMNEPFSYDETLYDMMAISYYELGDYQKSLEYNKRALKINPNNERIQNNQIILENLIQKKN